MGGGNVGVHSHGVTSEDECMGRKGRDTVNLLLEFPRTFNEGWESRADGLELDV